MSQIKIFWILFSYGQTRRPPKSTGIFQLTLNLDFIADQQKEKYYYITPFSIYIMSIFYNIQILTVTQGRNCCFGLLTFITMPKMF